MKTPTVETTNVYGAELSRRGFLRAGGALIVGFTLIKSEAAEAATQKNTLDASLPESWVEIHADNTILMRTGKVDFGQVEIRKYGPGSAHLVAGRVGATVGEYPNLDVSAGRGLNDAFERGPDDAALVVREYGE